MKKTTAKRSGGFKVCAVVLAILIIGVALTMAITQGFTNWNPYGWFDKKGNLENPAGGESTGGENGAVLPEEVVGERMTLYSAPIAREAFEANGISAQADSAYRLTVTVTPADAYYPDMDWSIAFKDSSASWAIGKSATDYGTVTPTSNGARTADFVCNRAFGEQLVISAVSRDNPDISVSCEVNYVKRIAGTPMMNGQQNRVDIKIGSEKNPQTQLTYGFTDGTLDGEVRWFGWGGSQDCPSPSQNYPYTLEYTEDFKEEFLTKYYAYTNIEMPALTCANGKMGYAALTSASIDGLKSAFDVGGVKDQNNGVAFNETKFKRAIYYASNEAVVDAKLYFDVCVYYNGKEYDRKTVTVNVYFDASAVYTKVTGASIDKTELIV